jgi:hypothetical protein
MKRWILYLSAALLMVVTTLTPECIAYYHACCKDMQVAHSCCDNETPVIKAKYACCDPVVIKFHSAEATLNTDTIDLTVSGFEAPETPVVQHTALNTSDHAKWVCMSTAPPPSKLFTLQSRFNL